MHKSQYLSLIAIAVIKIIKSNLFGLKGTVHCQGKLRLGPKDRNKNPGETLYIDLLFLSCPVFFLVEPKDGAVGLTLPHQISFKKMPHRFGL